MIDSLTTTLYVKDLQRSMKFYAQILGTEPQQFAPMLAFIFQPSGGRMALMEHGLVTPPPSAPGGFELAISLWDENEVDAVYRSWREAGVTMTQPPTDHGFCYAFLAEDPDGNRVRVYRPTGFSENEKALYSSATHDL